MIVHRPSQRLDHEELVVYQRELECVTRAAQLSRIEVVAMRTRLVDLFDDSDTVQEAGSDYIIGTSCASDAEEDREEEEEETERRSSGGNAHAQTN